MKNMTKAKATKHSVVIRSVHNARVPIPTAAKKEALALIRSAKKERVGRFGGTAQHD